MELFRGYVEIKDKKSVEPFKNNKNLKVYDDVKNLNGYAGILKKNVILIDVDDFEESEILLKIINDYNIKATVFKTSRGKHFYFKNNEIKNCSTNSKLAIGINADIKSGFKNCYGILKNNGVERELVQDFDELDELPKWLFPVVTRMDFLDMEAGEGRNQKLFGYILPLQSSGFSKEEARKTINLINEYILKDPLSSDELEVILRDEAFNKDIFFQGRTFLFNDFAKFIISNDYIIKLNNQLHIYSNGIYQSDIYEIEKKMIEHIPMLNKTKRNEVISYINLIVEDKRVSQNENLIAFKNGIYDLQTDSLIGFDPNYIITNLIDWDYNPNAYCELTDKTLNKISCDDEDIRSLLEEMIGYCFYRRNELRKAFVLIGNTANGKSTFLDLISYILGDKNISALDLAELDQRFKTVELFGKLANIGDDIGDEFIPNTSVFKKLVSGERLNVERKGQDPFDFLNYSKLIFSANNIPRMGRGKDSSAISNRLIIVPFNATFSKSDPDFDPFIKYKLRSQESIEYLIKLGIEGLKRVLINQGFTLSKQIIDQLNEYEKLNNPILEFLDEFGDVKNKSTSEVYYAYSEYCIENGYSAISHNRFSRFLKDKFNLKICNSRIDGVQYKTFVEDI